MAMSAQRNFDPKDSGYVEVAQRIAEFAEHYPEGSLQSELLPSPIEGGILMKAYAFRGPDDARPGIGHAWEPVPGKTPYTRDSEVMNAETSAWGRAIVAALAASTKRGVASADEITNRQLAADQKSYKARMAADKSRHLKGLAGKEEESEETGTHQGVGISDADGASSPAESSGAVVYGEGAAAPDAPSEEGVIGPAPHEEIPPRDTAPPSGPEPPSSETPDFTFARGKYLGFKCSAVAEKDPAWLRENLSGIKNPKNRAIAEQLLGITAAPEETSS
jgi:hypothetical protein